MRQNRTTDSDPETRAQSQTRPGLSRTGRLVAPALISVSALVASGCAETIRTPCPPAPPCAGPDAGTPPEKRTTRPPMRKTKPRRLINRTLWQPLDETRTERADEGDRLWEPLDKPRRKCPSAGDLWYPLDLPSHCKKPSEVDNRL